MKSNLKIPPRSEVAEMMRKFENTYQIVEMLKHFQNQHDFTNQALRETGEGGRCKPFDIQPLTIGQIKNYIYEREGLKL